MIPNIGQHFLFSVYHTNQQLLHMPIKAIFLLCFLFNLSLIFCQSNEGQLQKEFDSQIETINQLAQAGNIHEAIEKAKSTKEFAFNNFKTSNYNQKTILYKLNFFYRYIKNSEGELATNIELNKLRENDLIAESSSFQNSLKELISFYDHTSNPREVIPVFTQANEHLNNHIKDALKQRFEDEKSLFLDKNIKPYFNLFQSFAYKTDYKYQVFNNVLLNNTLLIKGALLNSSKDILKTLKTLNDDLVSKKIKIYRDEKDFISLQLCLPENQRHPDLATRQERLRGLEPELISIYRQKFQDQRENPINWRRTQLNENEIAVEFTHFKYYYKKWTDSIIYVAEVFKKDWRYPKIIPLFEEAQLKQILNQKSATQIYQSRGSQGRKTNATNYAKEIYNLIITPIEPLLKDNKTIYFSPDGILHQIAFAALKSETGKLLIEDFELIQVSNSTVIKREKNEPLSKNILLIGGVNYDFDVDKNVSISDEKKGYLDMPTFSKSKSTTNRNSTWPYLQGTQDEIDNLEKLFNSKAKQCMVLNGDTATENALKKLSSNSPNILHIATHGFFFEDLDNKDLIDENQTQYQHSENPLLRSGLLFAHANYTWLNGHNSFEDEDGILTALEISNLDLSQTDLVVLSACETGLGDIKGNEGVYGLQRAFKMAGVDMIIMSLWEVPDIETAEFMENFYNLWLENNDIRKSFVDTQRKMLALYPDNPEKWAAFVLLE